MGSQSWWDYLGGIAAGAAAALCVPDLDASALGDGTRAQFLDPEMFALFDDTLPALRRVIECEFDCCIASNHIPELEQIVRRLGLTELVRATYTSGTIGIEKPSARFFSEILKAEGVPPSEALMIGDNYVSDVVGARASGIRAVLVRRENPQAYPYYFPSFISLADALCHA